jgi:hypothetical protein
LIAPTRRIIDQTAQPAANRHRAVLHLNQRSTHDFDARPRIRRRAARTTGSVGGQQKIIDARFQFERNHPAGQLDYNVVQRIGLTGTDARPIDLHRHLLFDRRRRIMQREVGRTQFVSGARRAPFAVPRCRMRQCGFAFNRRRPHAVTVTAVLL